MANMHLVTGYANKEHIKSADQGSFNAAVLGEGEFVLERGNKFAHTIISNNIVRIKDGDILMQGRHIRLDDSTYIDLEFDNGQQGYKRNDLIVVRYTKDSASGIEETSLVVLKGTPTTGEPSDPTHQTGDIIYDHALINEMPLYRVPFDGLNIQNLVCLFEVLPSWKTLKAQSVEETQKAIQTAAEQKLDQASNPSYMTDGKHQVKCLGIEDFWGNIYEWIDGLVTDSSNPINILTNTDNFQDNGKGAGYMTTSSGMSSGNGGYMKEPQGSTETGFTFKASGGSSTTYFTDYASLSGGYVASFGGLWFDGADAGAFRLRVYYSASDSSAYVSARLMYL